MGTNGGWVFGGGVGVWGGGGKLLLGDPRFRSCHSAPFSISPLSAFFTA